MFFRYCFIAAVLLLCMAVSPEAKEAADQPSSAAELVMREYTELMSMLQGHQFAALDNHINDLQRSYEEDTGKEYIVANKIALIRIPDPELEQHFLAWLEHSPSSYAAHLSAGLYYFSMAAAWRGTDFIKDTADWRLDVMRRFADKAEERLKHSLTLTDKPTLSYSALISITNMAGGSMSLPGLLSEAIKRDPYCVRPRDEYMRSLEPRWGGSYSEMTKFADEISREEHPKLKDAAAKYKAWIQWYRGLELGWKNDHVASLSAFNEALAIKEFTGVLYRRARLYKTIGQRDLALADVDRVLSLNPRHDSALSLRGLLLLDKLRTEEAMQHLRIAALLGENRAINELGYLFTKGLHGVPVNTAEGISWWKKSAYFGNAYASYQLGGTYAHGAGVPVDYAEAVRYFRIATAAGDEKAMNELGLLVWYGKGTTANREEATELWVRAAEKGIWQASHNLRFFLGPAEYVKVMAMHPNLVLKDKTLIWYVAAFVALLLLVTTLVVIAVVRAQRAKMRAR